jgi:hypothetical protein
MFPRLKKTELDSQNDSKADDNQRDTADFCEQPSRLTPAAKRGEGCQRRVELGSIEPKKACLECMFLEAFVVF